MTDDLGAIPDGLGLALREVVNETAAGLEGLERVALGDETELRRVGRAFASLGGSGAEFRLGTDIAAAARRTPGVGPSPRGSEWIRFQPETLDRFSLDRAAAWTELAWRRATG